VKNKNESCPKKTDVADEIKIDLIDFDIIDELTLNSRASFREIAKKLGVSTDTVSRRYKKLVQNRVIRSVITIDPTKFGYKTHVYTEVKLTSQIGPTTIFESLKKIPDVWGFLLMTGDYDITIMSITRDFNHYFEIQDEIKKNLPIQIINQIIAKYP
jgi:DNA-binding Lrp family transcriptional regulator